MSRPRRAFCTDCGRFTGRRKPDGLCGYCRAASKRRAQRHPATAELPEHIRTACTARWPYAAPGRHHFFGGPEPVPPSPPPELPPELPALRPAIAAWSAALIDEEPPTAERTLRDVADRYLARSGWLTREQAL